MSKGINIAGQKFGKLIAIRQAGKNKWKQYLWLCKCDCGKATIVLDYNLNSGHTQSCGCLRIKHGHSQNDKTYKSWCDIIQRCTNTNNKRWKDYGGRGITVCERWKNSFERFLKDMGESPGLGYSLDRIKNKLGYYKENCRWATSKQQNRNSRNNHLETYNGKTQCVAAWAEEYNIPYKTLWARLYIYNWPIEKALTTPIRKSKTGELLEYQSI